MDHGSTRTRTMNITRSPVLSLRKTGCNLNATRFFKFHPADAERLVPKQFLRTNPGHPLLSSKHILSCIRIAYVLSFWLIYYLCCHRRLNHIGLSACPNHRFPLPVPFLPVRDSDTAISKSQHPRLSRYWFWTRSGHITVCMALIWSQSLHYGKRYVFCAYSPWHRIWSFYISGRHSASPFTVISDLMASEVWEEK